MKVGAYYNEHDPFAAAWLRELIQAGMITPGEVDERSIEEVQPSDLGGFAQCHFFAGIGGWPYALRLAGWSDSRPVWTGSCPCQPLSCAGQRQGHADRRHLWPAFYRLIAECRPPVVFGEQVASEDGWEWLAAVRADLEGVGYACGGADLCAAGISAPHKRQRLFFVADAEHAKRRAVSFDRQDECNRNDERRSEAHRQLRACSEVFRLADAENTDRRSGECGAEEGIRPDGIGRRRLAGDGEVGELGNAADDGSLTEQQSGEQEEERRMHQPKRSSFWADADWLYCTDDKWRPVEPGTFPLAHGVPARVGRLRGYGNAIVPQVAQAFIEAYLDLVKGHP